VFRLADFTSGARAPVLAAKDAVLAAGAAAAAPAQIRIRRHWGALQGLVDELQNVVEFDFNLLRQFERFTTPPAADGGVAVETAYIKQQLGFQTLADEAGEFVLSPCALRRIGADPLLAPLLPALQPLADVRFSDREAFAARLRTALAQAPQLQAGAAPKDEPALRPDERLLRAIARIVRAASTWVRTYRVRQAVDRVLNPGRYPGADSTLRPDLADTLSSEFDAGQLVRRWLYYDYVGPPVGHGEHDGARYEFNEESGGGVQRLDSQAAKPLELRGSALAQVGDVERLVELLLAATGGGLPTRCQDKFGAAQLDAARGVWEKARTALAGMRAAIGAWYLLPSVPRLPLQPEQQPLLPTGPGLLWSGDTMDLVRCLLDEEESLPAPTYSLLFQSDRPNAADLTLAETAQPLAQILQQPAQLDELIARLEQWGLEAVEPLALALHGHTDRTASETHNQALSERRAQWLRDRIAARCRPPWSIDDAVLAALKRAGAEVCALEDLATLAGRRYLHDRSTTLAILTAVVEAAEAQRLLPVIEKEAVRPLFARIEPVVGHGEAEASGPEDDNPRDRRAVAVLTAAGAR
jgi:hypothetical protein